jgi:hypothetical protein
MITVDMDVVRDRVVQLAGEVQLHAVGEVSAVRKLQAQDGVAGRGDGREHSRVGGGAGVRLNIGVFSTEERLCAVDRELLRDVDVFASAVVTASGVTLGVLVCQHGALRLQDGARDEVLARDHLEVVTLAPELLLEYGSDLRVDDVEGIVECGCLLRGTG